MDLRFLEGDQPLHITTGGNVGIGTTDPSAQLTVSGDGITTNISTGTNANNGEARIGVVGNNSRPNFELGPHQVIQMSFKLSMEVIGEFEQQLLEI